MFYIFSNPGGKTLVKAHYPSVAYVWMPFFFFSYHQHSLGNIWALFKMLKQWYLITFYEVLGDMALKVDITSTSKSCIFVQVASFFQESNSMQTSSWAFLVAVAMWVENFTQLLSFSSLCVVPPFLIFLWGLEYF